MRKIISFLFGWIFSFNIVQELIKDSLKIYDRGRYRFSKTSLTMFSAWLLVIYMTFFVLYKEGFRYDVFATLVGIAIGVKGVDAISQNIKKNKK